MEVAFTSPPINSKIGLKTTSPVIAEPTSNARFVERTLIGGAAGARSMLAQSGAFAAISISISLSSPTHCDNLLWLSRGRSEDVEAFAVSVPGPWEPWNNELPRRILFSSAFPQ